MTEWTWEDHADWWIDRFTDGVDPEYVEQFVPMALSELAGFDSVLDLGCGEGQIGRALAGSGADVVGVDPTVGQLRVAIERGGGPRYVRAGSSALPFADGSFDAVVVCLVIEHVDALEETLGEIARVLRPDGRLAWFLNHPLFQTPGSGWIDDHMVDPPEQYWRVGPYLDEEVNIEPVEPGVHIRFVHRSLSTYVNALADADLFIERMEEPPPPAGFLDRAPEYREAQSIPRLLYLRCARR
jgi:SAM-dependent methyltransferase